MRFNNPAEVRAWADKAAAEDLKREALGWDRNPYSTPSRRHDWQRGYDGSPPHSWESTLDYDTAYQRGAAYKRLTTKV